MGTMIYGTYDQTDATRIHLYFGEKPECSIDNHTYYTVSGNFAQDSDGGTKYSVANGKTQFYFYYPQLKANTTYYYGVMVETPTSYYYSIGNITGAVTEKKMLLASASPISPKASSASVGFRSFRTPSADERWSYTPPTITLSAPSGITATAAKVQGTYRAATYPAYEELYIGTSTSNMELFKKDTDPSAYKSSTWFFNLNGLHPNTKYYYQYRLSTYVVGSNGSEILTTVKSDIASFTTLASEDTDTCSCSPSYAGWYQVYNTTGSLAINNKHNYGTGVTQLGTIPEGTYVYITAATGYNG